MEIAVIDTSAFLLIIDRSFDVIDHLSEDLGGVLRCITTDSVIREILSLKDLWGSSALFDKYVEKIFEKCYVYALSEDLEKEDADHDVLRLAASMRGYIVAIDKELKKIARSMGVRVIHYRESKNMLEEE